MTVPALFTARDGVVRFCWQPVPDWTAYSLARALRGAALDAPANSRLFDGWSATLDQLRDAVSEANRQRRLAMKPSRSA